jgi:predicted RNA-binding Zn ribbon-like protein
MTSEVTTDATSRPDEPLAIELLNTVRLADGDAIDAFATDVGVVDWLQAMGPRLTAALGTPPDNDLLLAAAPRVRRLRGAARQLAEHAVSDPRPAVTPQVGEHAEAVRVVNAEAASWVQLDWPADAAPQRGLAARGDGADLVVNALGREVVELLTSGEHRLRPCLAPSCAYFFWKHARREWCSAACGNRARVARHYRRHRSDSLEQ